MYRITPNHISCLSLFHCQKQACPQPREREGAKQRERERECALVFFGALLSWEGAFISLWNHTHKTDPPLLREVLIKAWSPREKQSPHPNWKTKINPVSLAVKRSPFESSASKKRIGFFPLAPRRVPNREQRVKM